MREGSRLDRVVSTVCVVSASIPTFASTVFLSALFVFQLHWLPGTSSMIDGFSFKELDPAGAGAGSLRLRLRCAHHTRIDGRGDDRTVRTHRVLKGLPYRRVIVRHALRNALITPVTVLLLHVNWLIAGVIVVEFFFAYKGFGSLILTGALARDLFLLEACTMVTVIIAVATQTVADIAYTFLNPRIRLQ